MKELTAQELACMRFYNSGLTRKFETPLDCARALFGIQGQVQQFTELNIFNRVKNLDRGMLQKLYDRHELIKVWAQRMTIHLFAKTDWPAVVAVYGNRKNFATSMWGVNDDLKRAEVMETLEDFVSRSDHKNRVQIGEIIESVAGGMSEEYRDYCSILQATMEGRIFGVPEHPHTKRFRHWKFCFQEKAPVGCVESHIERMMRAYFTLYAPASFRDFLHWSGLTKGESIQVFERLSPEFKKFSFNGRELLSLNEKETPKKPGVLMLGKFDPLMVAYSDKTWIADESEQKLIWRAGGHVESIVSVDGKFAGTWRHVSKGRHISFNYFLSKKISPGEMQKLKACESRIAKLFGKLWNPDKR